MEQQGVLSKTEGTEVKWKDGKDLTKKKKQKKQRNKKTNATRTVVVEVDDESFFSFFKSQKMPDEAELDKMDSEEEDNVGAKLDMDFDRGNDILDELIPEALEYFLGIVEQDEDSMDGPPPDDSQSSEGEKEKEKKKKKKKKKDKGAEPLFDLSNKKGEGGAGGAAGAADEKVECKQQ